MSIVKTFTTPDSRPTAMYQLLLHPSPILMFSIRMQRRCIARTPQGLTKSYFVLTQFLLHLNPSVRVLGFLAPTPITPSPYLCPLRR
jgi:hypothetical protein